MGWAHKRTFSRRALVLVMVVGAFVATAALGTAGAVSAGSISGRLVDATSGQPIEGICVSLEKGPSTTTGADGSYALADVEPGSYTLQFTDCTATPRFVAQWYLGADSSQGATPVTVSDGGDTALGDVSLVEGVVVSGTVTGDGVALAGANVEINPQSAGVGANATTDAEGHYATAPLPTGSYRVRFTSGPAGTWAPRYWQNQISSNTADTLELAPAAVPSRTGVDADLQSAAQIGGTVTDSEGGPLAGICVDANTVTDGSWNWINGATTGPTGAYVIDSLPPTSLLVHFHDCSSGPHLDQWYQGASGPDTATSIALAPGEDRQGIDAQLTTGIVVSGHVSDGTGAPLAGISVSVNPVENGPGGWAQTDGDGNYVTNGLPAGDYRVQFSAPGPDPAWATQYWHDRPTWNTADPLHLDAADGANRGGVDAVMSASAKIRGVVRTDGGSPVQGICVNAVVDTPNGPDFVGGTESGSDGSYEVSGLPALATKVRFDDCHHVGPYAEQWWDRQPAYSSATPIALTPGSVSDGIDAALTRAGAITGHVTDRTGHPLSGICAQATTASAFGGLAVTDESGDYSIVLAASGTFHVQFVDCNDTPAYRAQWWDDQPTAATAAPIPVGASETVGDIDALLDPGGPATITGRVATLRGTPLSSACVVAYLPNQFARFAPVADDGTYSIAGVPSGTFALAALSCEGGGEPGPIVNDPAVSGVAYRALWWNQVPLAFDQGDDGGPDPIAQGANLVTVEAGASLTDHDFCFGCGAVDLVDVVSGGTSVTLTFTTPGLVPPEVGSQAADLPLTYTATCTSSNGALRSTSGPAATLTVVDLTPGATYSCGVTASADGTEVASSATSASFVVPGGADDRPASASAGLAFTGRSPARLLEVALAMLAIGALLVLATRRRRI